MGTPNEYGRRWFSRWLTRGFLSLWGVGFFGVILSYLKKPETPRSVGLDVIRVGDAASLSPGSARLVKHGSRPLFVLRLRSGELVALSALCTHYRCVLNWNDERQVLECPCHRAVFSATGEVLSGLPRRALPGFRVEVRLGEVIVHLS